MDRSERQRLQREQRELKAPQERSDEEIEAVPTESDRLERKSIISTCLTVYHYQLNDYILNTKKHPCKCKGVPINTFSTIKTASKLSSFSAASATLRFSCTF